MNDVYITFWLRLLLLIHDVNDLERDDEDHSSSNIYLEGGSPKSLKVITASLKLYLALANSLSLFSVNFR